MYMSTSHIGWKQKDPVGLSQPRHRMSSAAEAHLGVEAGKVWGRRLQGIEISYSSDNHNIDILIAIATMLQRYNRNHNEDKPRHQRHNTKHMITIFQCFRLRCSFYRAAQRLVEGFLKVVCKSLYAPSSLCWIPKSMRTRGLHKVHRA